MGKNERTASIGAGGDEPAREDHRLKGGGAAVLVVVEEEGLHGLCLVVQIHYLLFLNGPQEKHNSLNGSTFFTHEQFLSKTAFS